jgi:hypothetical protein
MGCDTDGPPGIGPPPTPTSLYVIVPMIVTGIDDILLTLLVA